MELSCMRDADYYSVLLCADRPPLRYNEYTHRNEIHRLYGGGIDGGKHDVNSDYVYGHITRTSSVFKVGLITRKKTYLEKPIYEDSWKGDVLYATYVDKGDYGYPVPLSADGEEISILAILKTTDQVYFMGYKNYIDFMNDLKGGIENIQKKDFVKSWSAHYIKLKDNLQKVPVRCMSNFDIKYRYYKEIFNNLGLNKINSSHLDCNKISNTHSILGIYKYNNTYFLVQDDVVVDIINQDPLDPLNQYDIDVIGFRGACEEDGWYIECMGDGMLMHKEIEEGKVDLRYIKYEGGEVVHDNYKYLTKMEFIMNYVDVVNQLIEQKQKSLDN